MPESESSNQERETEKTASSRLFFIFAILFYIIAALSFLIGSIFILAIIVGASKINAFIGTDSTVLLVGKRWLLVFGAIIIAIGVLTAFIGKAFSKAAK